MWTTSRIGELVGVVACSVVAASAIHAGLAHLLTTLDGLGLAPPLTDILAPRALGPAAHEARRLFVELGVVFGALIAAWRTRASTWTARFFSWTGAAVLFSGCSCVLTRLLERQLGFVPFGLATACLVQVPIAGLGCASVLVGVERAAGHDHPGGMASLGGAMLVVLLGLSGYAMRPVSYQPRPAHTATMIPCRASQHDALVRLLGSLYPMLSLQQRHVLANRLEAQRVYGPPCRPPSGVSIRGARGVSVEPPPQRHALSLSLAAMGIAAAVVAAGVLRHRTARAHF
ncbi:MAG: hypothetical protein ABI321_00655 [Polyangia bacterium]